MSPEVHNPGQTWDLARCCEHQVCPRFHELVMRWHTTSVVSSRCGPMKDEALSGGHVAEFRSPHSPWVNAVSQNWMRAKENSNLSQVGVQHSLLSGCCIALVLTGNFNVSSAVSVHLCVTLWSASDLSAYVASCRVTAGTDCSPPLLLRRVWKLTDWYYRIEQREKLHRWVSCFSTIQV